MALYPQAGDIDLMVATELAEAGRASANGFVTPGPHDPDFLVASFLSARREDGHGRQPARCRAAGEGRAQHGEARCAGRLRPRRARGRHRHQRRDARRDCGLRRILPIPVAAFEKAVRGEGKAVDASMRGFDYGLGCGAR